MISNNISCGTLRKSLSHWGISTTRLGLFSPDALNPSCLCWVDHSIIYSFKHEYFHSIRTADEEELLFVIRRRWYVPIPQDFHQCWLYQKLPMNRKVIEISRKTLHTFIHIINRSPLFGHIEIDFDYLSITGFHSYFSFSHDNLFRLNKFSSPKNIAQNRMKVD